MLVSVASFGQSCTNLDEELYSEVTPDNFFKTDEEFISALELHILNSAILLQTILQHFRKCTTDERRYPTRGQDWDDGGNSRRAPSTRMDKEDGIYERRMGIWFRWCKYS